VHPSGSGGVYANFPDTDLPDEHRAYWGGNLERVRRVKEKYDPERVFGKSPESGFGVPRRAELGRYRDG
jgi:Berberine and berberine like